MRCLLLIALLVAACSKGPESDLPTIGEARSLAAEWALVNEQALKDHVTSTYAEMMRARLREALQTQVKTLTKPDSDYGHEIRATVALPADTSPASLRAHVRALKQIEDKLESA
jgi:hypothetical protein